MSTASDLLALYLEAEARILRRQSYTIGDRTFTLANLAEVRRERERLEKRVAAESTGDSGRVGPRHLQADFSA
jgi:hypothetical protein